MSQRTSRKQPLRTVVQPELVNVRSWTLHSYSTHVVGIYGRPLTLTWGSRVVRLSIRLFEPKSSVFIPSAFLHLLSRRFDI